MTTITMPERIASRSDLPLIEKVVLTGILSYPRRSNPMLAPKFGASIPLQLFAGPVRLLVGNMSCAFDRLSSVQRVTATAVWLVTSTFSKACRNRPV
jgi:hypothetical protein